MAEFSVLGTDQEIDTSDPMESVLTLVYVVLGAAVLFMALPIGRQLGSTVNERLAEALGMNVGDSDPGMTFGGD